MPTNGNSIPYGGGGGNHGTGSGGIGYRPVSPVELAQAMGLSNAINTEQQRVVNASAIRGINVEEEEEPSDYVCDRCEEVFSDRDEVVSLEFGEEFGYSDYLCNSCYTYCEDHTDNDDEEDEEEEMSGLPVYDDKDDCPVFTDKEVLSTLDKDCTFGIEFECVGGASRDGLGEIASNLGFTSSGDGSVSGSNATEYQTSVLQGESGGRKVLRFLGFANKKERVVNDSCGTHVHLGALDFFDNFAFALSNLKDSEHKEKVIVERTLLLKLAEVKNQEQLTEWLSDMYMRGQNEMGYTSNYRMIDNRLSRYTCTKMKVERSDGYHEWVTFIVRDSTLEKLDFVQEDYDNGNKYLVLQGISQKSKSNIEIKAEDVCVYSRERSDKYEKLKTLFYTYRLFEKLLFSMLPENRKESSYCNPLSTSYTLKAIANCDSQEDIEKLWYKTNSLREVATAKKQHYEDSRYHALNLHAMFFKYGTIEIRTHHGTLNAHSILMWTALHQAIRKAVLNGQFNYVFGMNGRSMKTVLEQYRQLIKTLQIKGTPLDTFIKHRINKFSPKSLVELNK